MPRAKKFNLRNFIAPTPAFSIDIHSNSVDVRLDASTASPRRRFFALVFYIIFIVLLEALKIYDPGKHGDPSIAHDLSQAPINSSLFRFAIALFLVLNGFMLFILRRALWGFFPSDETLHCDSSTLSISKVRWFDTTNTHWSTRTFPITGISQMRFAMVAPDTYQSRHGLRFLAHGKQIKTLPGLNARQANKILEGLQNLGVDLKETYRFKKRTVQPAADSDSNIS